MTEREKKSGDGKLLKTTTALFILNLSASALNFLCQLVMARVLSVEAYGTINTIFSFMMIVAVPGTTLTMIAAKYYAGSEHPFGKRAYLNRQTRIVLGLTAGVLIVLICLKSVFAKVLAIEDTFVLIMAFLLAAFGYFQPFYSGVFSGNKYFILVGVYSLFIPIYKMAAIGGAYLYTGEDRARLNAILVIMMAGLIITAVYGHMKSCRIIGKEEETGEAKGKLYTREDLRILFLNLSLMLYMNIDVLAVRQYASGTESGLYGAVLLFGRIVYYFATTLGTILLPSVADEKMSGEKKHGTLNKALALMIGFVGVCMIPINLMKEFFIRILYGEAYLGGAKYVLFISFIALSLSLFTIMINYTVGIGKTKKPAMVMLAVDVLLGGAVMMLSEVQTILITIAVIGLAGTAAIYLIAKREREKEAEQG